MVLLGGPSLSLKAGWPKPGPRSDWKSVEDKNNKHDVILLRKCLTVRRRPPHASSEEHGVEDLGPEDSKASQDDGAHDDGLAHTQLW